MNTEFLYNELKDDKSLHVLLVVLYKYAGNSCFFGTFLQYFFIFLFFFNERFVNYLIIRNAGIFPTNRETIISAG